MKATCPVHGTRFDLSRPPSRIVSFVSSATETLFELGAGASIIGVTPYCSRYVADLAAPVVGDYLQADLEALKALNPDLVLVTQGIQAAFGRRMAKAGLPVYALPLPASRWGILENQLTLGGLVHRVAEARALNERMEAGFQALLAQAPARRPRVFTELWFGRHQRTIQGLTFIADLIRLAGGEPLEGSAPGAYPTVDLAAVTTARPDLWLCFDEPEHPVDPAALAQARGWSPAPPCVHTGVAKGSNPIHDGPSFLDTARWLHQRFQAFES